MSDPAPVQQGKSREQLVYDAIEKRIMFPEMKTMADVNKQVVKLSAAIQYLLIRAQEIDYIPAGRTFGITLPGEGNDGKKSG